MGCLGQTTSMLRRHGTRMGCPRTLRASRLAVWPLRAMLAAARTSLTATSGLASRQAVRGPRHLLAHPPTRPTPRFSRSRPPTGLLRPMCSITLTWLTSTLLPTGLPKPRPTWTVLLLRTSAVVTQTLCLFPSTWELRSPTPLLLPPLTLAQTQRPCPSMGTPPRPSSLRLRSGTLPRLPWRLICPATAWAVPQELLRISRHPRRTPPQATGGPLGGSGRKAKPAKSRQLLVVGSARRRPSHRIRRPAPVVGMLVVGRQFLALVCR